MPVTPRSWNTADAPCVAALWLLVVSVFLGPAGLGGSRALAATTRVCSVSCPCDEGAQHDHDDHVDNVDNVDRAGDARSGNDHDGDPCRDPCPDDCPDCGCFLGIAMAILPLPMTSSTLICRSARVLAPVDAPPSGAYRGVYRPPRSLT